MRASFSLIFWGLMIVTLDLGINNIDLLPDGIGYLLMAVGCSRLRSVSPRFVVASLLSVAMAVAWVVGLILTGKAAEMFGYGVGVVNGGMMWMLLAGLGDVGTQYERPELAARATGLAVAYIALIVLVAAMSLVAHDLHDPELPILVILIAGVTIQAMILYLIYQMRRLVVE